MKRFLLILAFFILCPLASSAAAWDVLIVQKFRARPYAEVARGFKSVAPGRVSELVLDDNPAQDPIREILRRGPDLILALGTEALSRIDKIYNIPIIYCMVLNPETFANRRDNITGISMFIRPESQLAALRKVLPDLRSVGLVYDPEKTGAFMESARFAARKMGIDLFVVKAEHSKDFLRALEDMPKDLGAYWMIPDSTFATSEAVEMTILFSMKNRIPVFTFSEKYLRMGAFMSLELNAFDVGKQAGEMALKIRSGTPVKDIPRAYAEHAIPSVNHSVAAKFGIPLNGTAPKKTP